MSEMSEPAPPGAVCRNGSHLGSVVLAMLVWSTSFVATKIAYASFAPLTLGACRFVIATFLLAAVLAAKRQLIRPNREDLGWLALSGFLGITLYFTMENVGLSLTSASNAAMIVASYPAIAIILERLIYGTPITWSRTAGIALAVVGVYLISRGSSEHPNRDKLLGDIILALTGIVWAFYNFVTRKVVNRYSALTVSFYQTVAGTLAFIPLTFLETGRWSAPTPAALAALAYLGILCSVAAFMLYNYGLRRLSAASAVALANLIPVFGVLFSVMVLNEEVRTGQLIGGVVVISGVFLSVREEEPIHNS